METVDNIWKELKDDCLSCIDVMGKRQSILMDKVSFQKHLRHFDVHGGFLRGNGCRTGQNYRHLHAKQYGDNYEIHVDYGNVAKNIFWAPVHLFSDVIPYILFCVIKHKRYSFSPIDLHNYESHSTSLLIK